MQQRSPVKQETLGFIGDYVHTRLSLPVPLTLKITPLTLQLCWVCTSGRRFSIFTQDTPSCTVHQPEIPSMTKMGCSCVVILPGADGHLVWVVDVGTAVATVTLAKAVVVHAVLLLLLLLVSVSDDGEAPLDCTASFQKTQTKLRYPQINNKQLAVTKRAHYARIRVSNLTPVRSFGSMYPPYVNFKRLFLALLSSVGSDERRLISREGNRRIKCKRFG